MILRKRWFSLDTPIKARTTRRTTVMWRFETAFWMSPRLTSLSRPMTPPLDDLVAAAAIQRFKMVKRYAPAQQDIGSQHNRLMYVLVKLL
ncbi:uncharacterized protein LOC119482544 [Tachysurus ichikawai]